MRLDGTIRHGLDFNVGNAGSWTTSVAFGPVIVSGGGGVQSDWSETDTSSLAYIKNKPSLATVATSGSYNDLSNKPTIPDAQIQADWNQTTNTAKDYIKNKPTIPTVPTNVSAFNNDAGYLNNNFCPIIEDTRSSAVTTITGVAPFSSLVDGQRITLLTKYNLTNYPTLNLTLDGGSTTGAKSLFASYASNGPSQMMNTIAANEYIDLIYEGANNRWVMVGNRDTNNIYGGTTQQQINDGALNVDRLITPKLFHDNAYIVEESYSSGSLKANKMYDFGTVSTALTIPSLDATNDLVSNALNFYALRFIAGADNISITFPTGVLVDDTPTINTGDYVEIMINLYVENNTNHFYASIKVWQAQ